MDKKHHSVQLLQIIAAQLGVEPRVFFSMNPKISRSINEDDWNCSVKSPTQMTRLIEMYLALPDQSYRDRALTILEGISGKNTAG